jgi:hypothetical protein
MAICKVCEDGAEIDEATKCIIPACGHEFHKDCIISWLCENYGKCRQCEHDNQLRYQTYIDEARKIQYRDFKYASSQARRKNAPRILHLCALKMRMEPLLFADENASEWAFSKRKGVRTMYTKYVRLSEKYNEKRQKVRLFTPSHIENAHFTGQKKCEKNVKSMVVLYHLRGLNNDCLTFSCFL